MSKLVTPHGGTLVDRIVPEKDIPALKARALKLPKITLDAREQADVELIATGAASPLTGFLGKADYQSVLDKMTLADGTIWSLPFTLAVEKTLAEEALKAKGAGLYDASGRLWAVITVSEIYERDPIAEGKAICKTDEDAHPGVAYLKSRPTTLVAGSLEVLPLPTDLPFAKFRLTPRQLRAEIEKRGWNKIAGFQTRNPIHRAHEHLTKIGLEFADGLVIHPLVGETKNDDVPASVRFQVYETLIEKYYPKDRTILAAFPAAMRYAGPREAVFHVIARKNYGITSTIIGRDHAGVGKYYGSLEAQQLVDTVDLGTLPLKLDPTFFCHACKTLASLRTCPHDASQRLELSGTKVREILRDGGHLPEEFTRPEIAEILRAYYAQASGGSTEAPKHHLSGAARAATSAKKPSNGFILWFTGLSGAGKSTLAEALTRRLANQLHFEILDGDDVRQYLSKGLGFSKEDRDTNIRRIGYVARLIAKNGTAVITAAISPYTAIRQEVRDLATKDGTTFIEVYVKAELDALVARDVKGLYKKAIAGEIQHFTGVSDPYEGPENPDVLVRSDLESVEESLGKILKALTDRGLVPPSAAVVTAPAVAAPAPASV
jgi:sulfate adenylyltransferase